MASTIFRVLPVDRGEACLLCTRRGAYLFDGGGWGGGLPRLLRERRVGKIRAAVCTSASPERLGGILDLLDHGHPVGEYWLPEGLRALCRAARGFDGGFPDWLVRCGWPVPVEASFPMPDTLPPVGGGPLRAGATLALLGAAACTGRLPDRPRPLTPGAAFDAVADMLLADCAGPGGEDRPLLCPDGRSGNDGLGDGDLGARAVRCARLLACRAQRLAVSAHGAAREAAGGMALAVAAEALLARDGVRVRWFRPSARPEGRLVSRHPVMCLNGLSGQDGPGQDGLGPALPDAARSAAGDKAARVSARALFQAARRLGAAGSGLVFLYGDAECGALLCGVSRLSFLGRRGVLPLTRPTVVTAPQQGGLGGEEAYARIRSADPGADVWVRSHFSHARRVAEGFRRQAVRLCLHNCRDRTVQEILLAFERGRWHRLSGGPCTCL